MFRRSCGGKGNIFVLCNPTKVFISSRIVQNRILESQSLTEYCCWSTNYISSNRTKFYQTTMAQQNNSDEAYLWYHQRADTFWQVVRPSGTCSMSVAHQTLEDIKWMRCINYYVSIRATENFHFRKRLFMLILQRFQQTSTKFKDHKYLWWTT